MFLWVNFLYLDFFFLLEKNKKIIAEVIVNSKDMTFYFFTFLFIFVTIYHQIDGLDKQQNGGEDWAFMNLN